MKIILSILLTEIGLFSLVNSSFCLTNNNVGFVTTTANTRRYKYYNYNNDRKYSQNLYSVPASSSSGNNVVRIQKRFNFTEDWTKTHSNFRFDTLNHSIIDSRIDWLMERLNLNEDEVAIIIKKFPIVLSLRHDTNLGPTMDYLKDQLMLQSKELSRLVQKYPVLLGSRIEKIQQNLDWCEERIILVHNNNTRFKNNKLTFDNRKRIKKIIMTCPELLKFNIDSNLNPKWNILKERLDLNETLFAKIFIKSPRILLLNYSTSIEPKLSWLQYKVDLDSYQLGRMIQKYPSLLCKSVEDTFEPKLLWLKERLFLDDSKIKKILVRKPNILAYSISTRMEPTLQWLTKRLNLQDSSQLGGIIERYPSLFGLDIENNLEPTFQFFCDCIGEEAAIQLLKKDPILLGYSLEKRLIPRHEEAQQARISVDIGCLNRMAKYTDKRWSISLDYQQKCKMMK